MYKSYFGFSCSPFENTHDQQFLFISECHEEVIAALQYFISNKKNFALVCGEVGTGKTMIVHHLLANLPETVLPILIPSPDVEYIDLLRDIAQALGVSTQGNNTLELTDELKAALIKVNSEGKQVLLIIDDAHLLSKSSFEHIRLISNIETTENKLLKTILIGQNELSHKLRGRDMRQFRQRININRVLCPMSASETIGYIDHRLKIAESSYDACFEQDCGRLLYKITGGVPRNINQLCDKALLTCTTEQRRKVTKKMLSESRDAINSDINRVSKKPALGEFFGFIRGSIAMSKQKKKILIADDRPDVIDALKSLLSQYEVITVPDSSVAADLAAREAFDLIITEYLVPSVSGIESISGKKSSEGESAREKASILKKFRTIIQEVERVEKNTSHENTVVQSKARHEKILESLNAHLREIDAERFELRLEVQRLHNKLTSTIHLKGELERDLALLSQEMARNNDGFQEKISSLEGELKYSIARTEAVQAEKTEIADELRRVIEGADRTAPGSDKKIESLTALLDETFAVAEELREVSADRQEELALLRRENDKIVSDFEKQIRSLSEKVSRAQSVVDTAESKRAEAEAEAVRVKNESADRINELNRKMEAQANDLRAAIAFAEQLAKERAEAEGKIASLDEDAGKSQELKAKVDSLTEELKEMAGIVEKALEEKARAEEKLLRLQQNGENSVATS